jgi:acyl carrier protein
MELEDEFGIKLIDDDYSDVRTVADLHAVVLGKLRDKDGVRDEPCLCPRVFCEVRRRVCELFDVPRSAVRTTSRLESLLPRVDRRRRLRQLADAVDVWLPPLDPPDWTGPAFGLAALAAGSAGFALLVQLGEQAIGLLWIAVFTMLSGLAWLSLRTFVPQLSVVVPEYVTVGWIVKRRAGKEHRRLARLAPPPPNHDEIVDRVNRVLSEQLSVPMDRITPQARLIDDLGMD